MNPLGDIEVQRALALARARESYPLLPRETLVQYCDAAWQAALRADPKGRDLLGAFDRALLTIAWTHRRTGGRVPLHELVEQTIPRIALQPFVAAPAALAETGAQAEEEVAAQPSRRPAIRRPLLRVPFTSPLPVGAAVAAGAIGLTLLHETRVLPIGPLEQSANDEAGVTDRSAPRTSDGSDPAPAVGDPLGSASVGYGVAGSVFASPEPGTAGAGAGGGGSTAAGASVAQTAESRRAGASGGGGAAPEALSGETESAEVASTPPARAEPVEQAAPPPRPPVVTIQLPEPQVVLAYADPPRSEPVPDESDEREDPDTGAPGDDPDFDEPPGTTPPGDDDAKVPESDGDDADRSPDGDRDERAGQRRRGNRDDDDERYPWDGERREVIEQHDRGDSGSDDPEDPGEEQDESEAPPAATPAQPVPAPAPPAAPKAAPAPAAPASPPPTTAAPSATTTPPPATTAPPPDATTPLPAAPGTAPAAPAPPPPAPTSPPASDAPAPPPSDSP